MSIKQYLDNGGTVQDLPKPYTQEEINDWYSHKSSSEVWEEAQERNEQAEQDKAELQESENLDRMYSNNYE